MDVGLYSKQIWHPARDSSAAFASHAQKSSVSLPVSIFIRICRRSIPRSIRIPGPSDEISSTFFFHSGRASSTARTACPRPAAAPSASAAAGLSI